MSKTGTFHLISGLYRCFMNFIFWPILTLQKVFYGHFSRSLRKCGLKTCITALNHDFFYFFHLVTWDDFDLYYGHKAQENLQMSVTLSMPIHWVCLLLTSKFYSPMSPSPKSRKFLLWPDLWRHQWPPGQIFGLIRVVHVQDYRMAFVIWKSVQ